MAGIFHGARPDGERAAPRRAAPGRDERAVASRGRGRGVGYTVARRGEPRAAAPSAARSAAEGGVGVCARRVAWATDPLELPYYKAEASRLVRLTVILVSSLVRGLSSDLTLRATGSDLATTSPATQVPPTAAPRPFPC